MHNNAMTKTIRLALCLLIGGISATTGVAAQEAALVTSEPRLDVTHYRVEGDALLSESELDALLAPFVGEKRSLSQIEEAARALENNLHDRGYVFYRVFIPAQKPVDGVLVLQVIHFNLGKVTVVGNEHFSTANIRRSLPALQEGAATDMSDLGRDLTAANASPAKQASVTFREGTLAETIDAEVRVKTAEPLNFFAGYTANRSLDPLHSDNNLYRLTFGVQHSNLFDLDHVLTMSYTTDPQDLGQLNVYSFFYQAPIYGTGLNLAGYYTHSDSNTGLVPQGAGFFNVSGKGDFYGARLTQALPHFGTARQTVGVSIDERYFENGTTFLGTKIQPNVASRPLSLIYTLNQDRSWGSYNTRIEYAVNLRGGGSNTPENYTLNGGDYRWDAWRYAADVFLEHQGWNFAGRLRGQWSNNKLIPGEQFGLGGAFYVRGFTDREVSGDYGNLLILEAKAPQILVPQLRPLIFIDGGETYSRALHHRESLLSVGVGLRWSSPQFESSLDLANVLDPNSLNPQNIRNRLYFALLYRF